MWEDSFKHLSRKQEGVTKSQVQNQQADGVIKRGKPQINRTQFFPDR